MAHHTPNRCNLAAPDVDPPRKSRRQPKSTPFTTTAAKPRHHPPDPDPTIASSTIHSISKRFSKLYTNHHKALAASKASNPPSKPQINTNLQAKAMAKSAIEDTSSKPITKSNPQHRKTLVEIEKDKLRASITGVIPVKSSKESQEDCDIKTDKIRKLSRKGIAKKESHEGCDIKRAFDSLSKSQDSGLLKESHKGYDGQRPSFLLSGRSKSYCSPPIELADFFRCNGVKVVSVDMPPLMQAHAVDSARKTHDSLEKFTSKALALTLKKEFDVVYGPAWHCIVGTHFGSFVTHSAGGFLYFSMDNKLYILLFKTTVRRAD